LKKQIRESGDCKEAAAAGFYLDILEWIIRGEEENGKKDYI